VQRSKYIFKTLEMFLFLAPSAFFGGGSEGCCHTRSQTDGHGMLAGYNLHLKVLISVATLFDGCVTS